MSKKNIKYYYEFEVAVKDSEQPLKFAIMQPNRRMREDGELFFASETSRFAKAGVLPRAAWNTILSNGGGTVSDSDREQYGKLLSKYRESSFDLQSMLIKSEGVRSPEENKKIDELLLEVDEIKKQIQAFESDQINIFENTAESKARNRTILWWILNLSMQKIGDEYLALFQGSSLEEKLDSYDKVEESADPSYLDAVRRFTYLITLWYLGSIDKTEDFAALDEDYMGKLTSGGDKNVADSVSAEPAKTSEQDSNNKPEEENK